MDGAAVERLRSQFPALKKMLDGKPAVFLDGPAGTQVPQRVMNAIVDYLTNHNANHGGLFATSVESDQVLEQAHSVVAEFVGADDRDTISFGANMTSLTFALSRALAQTWSQGDRIVLSRLEHDANFTPWRLAARDAGVEVKYIDIDPADCTLRLEQYAEAINDRTRLVAVGCASNAVGTVNPVKQICGWARDVGALSFLDAVHYAPHDLIDVKDWGCDFLACSAYKFFGPHVGILYGRKAVLEELQPYKLRPAPNQLPGRWMTGTQNHECIAGVTQAVEYLADIGRSDPSVPRRQALRNAFRDIRRYETQLLTQLLDGIGATGGWKVWGITDRDRMPERLPTISISHQELSPQFIAKRLGELGIFVWHGNYYALPLTEQLGVEPEGLVRIGLAHYNTAGEIERVLAGLRTLI